MYKLSLAMFFVIGLSLLAVGVVYLSLDEFMPYHSAALQAEWSELDVNYQGLILGLLKALGSGSFVAGYATTFMVISSVRKSPGPFRVLLPTVSTGYSALLCYATYTVYVNTPGNPPLFLTATCVAVALIASALLTWSGPRHDAGTDGWR